MKSSEKQLKIDIKYLKKVLDHNKDEINEVLQHIEKVGIGSAQYFCEEFVFMCKDENGNEDIDALDRVHHDAYLNIAVFNGMHWE